MQPACWAALMLAATLSASPSIARDIYIDPARGSDDRDGSSPASAWRHVPGDVKARSRAARHGYAAGDRLILRGGTEYRGRIHFPSVGTAGQPIELVGDAWLAPDGSRARLSAPVQSGRSVITAQFSAHIAIRGFALAQPAMQVPIAFSFAPSGHVTVRNIVDPSGQPVAARVEHHLATQRLLLAGSDHYQPFDHGDVLLADLRAPADQHDGIAAGRE
jgi:hypothetical protein